MNAVIKDENSKEGAFGWLQFEKKGLQELQRLALRAPMAMGVLLYLVNNMGAQMPLRSAKGPCPRSWGSVFVPLLEPWLPSQTTTSSRL